MSPMILRACLAGAMFASAAASAAQDKPPAQAFFQHPTFAGATISPTGRHVAIRVAPKQGRVQLVVIDTETLKPTVAAGFGDLDIASVQWVNDKRLVFTRNDREGEARWLVTRRIGTSLTAVDIDGSNMRDVGPANSFFAATREMRSDFVFLQQYSFAGRRDRVGDAVNIVRVDTRTGERITSEITRPPSAKTWWLDEKDVPRATLTYEKNRAAVMYLDPATRSWVTLTEFNPITDADAIHPLGFGPDGTLYVTRGAKDGAGSARVYRFDIAKKDTDPEPLVSIEGFDANPLILQDKDRVLGLRYLSDAGGTVWFDAKYKDIQAKVDKLLPRTVNALGIPRRPEVPVVLVRSSSDVEPGTYSIYDAAKDKLVTLGRALPDIEPARMGRRDFVKYRARDGREIPAWLTLPPGARAGAKLPLVVLVHGGPWLRGGSWHWDSESQFLASRGYAVLQPEFRGSRGYGFAHFKAGWKQWGLAMQDDLADGARWAVGKGIADPARMCIAGASYGGYAAMMGLVRDPELFKCGINWVGVTDIDLMYDISWSDTSEDAKQFGMPLMIGDQEEDAAQLKATSPLHNAGRIAQPVLLAYGGLDRRVPPEHGTRFRDAVKGHNPQVEWVEYQDEGHGWFLLKTRVDFWTRVEKFLERHIGKPP